MSTPGKKGLAMVWPKARISHGGMMRRAPSTQPMYQSGWEPDGGRRRLGGLVGPVEPHRVDLGQPARAGPARPPPAGTGPADLAAYCGHSREPTMLPSVRPGALELGVLLAPDHGQVGGEQADDQGGDDQHVEDEEAGDELGVGELPAEEQEGQPRAGHGDGQGDRVGHPHAGARQEVVEQGVAEEAVADGEHQQGDADDPVELPGPAEGAGEEHPAQVHDDGGDEHQRRPVVHLAHHQSRPARRS